MKLVGLTGGIASGKSSVGRLLRERGVCVVDADQLARDAVAVGTAALAGIVERFGGGVLKPDGALDRPALAALVFSDAGARTALNAIVHPEVARLAAERFAALSESGHAVCVYEVPLLFENRLEGICDVTIVVAVDERVQQARLMLRDALDVAQASARIATQMPLEQKKARATFVLDNSGSLEALTMALDALWPRVLERLSAQSAGATGVA